MCTSVSCSTGFVSYPDLCCYLSGTDEDMDEGTLMTQWFQLVNEKNELVRKETDLMFKCVFIQQQYSYYILVFTL